MPKKREIKIELNAKDEAKVHYEMEWGKNLEQISDELAAYFDKNPPADVPEAVSVIREIFHVNITVTPVRYWLKAKAIRTKSQEAYQQKPI